MSILEKVRLVVEHGDRVERAKDPETHEAIPLVRPTVGVKALAWLAKSPWAFRQALKWITAGAGALAAWMLAHGGGEQSEAVKVGAIAAGTFLFEQFVSWLCNKAGIRPPNQDEPEPATLPFARPDYASFSPFAPVTLPTHTMDDPPAISPLPRRNANPRTPPLGQKGVRIIAERKTVPPEAAEVVHGSLRAEADDGALVILSTEESGVRTLERSEWDFYVQAE